MNFNLVYTRYNIEIAEYSLSASNELEAALRALASFPPDDAHRLFLIGPSPEQLVLNMPMRIYKRSAYLTAYYHLKDRLKATLPAVYWTQEERYSVKSCREGIMEALTDKEQIGGTLESRAIRSPVSIWSNGGHYGWDDLDRIALGVRDGQKQRLLMDLKLP